MAKVSDLSALAGESVATGDLLMIVDVSATTSGSKKITLAEFHETFPVVISAELTGAGTAATDELAIFDAGVPKTISVAEFFAAWPAAITTELTGAGTAGTDELLISDAGTPKTISVTELFTSLPVVLSTELDGSAVVGTDEFIISDAGVMKTITMAEVIQAVMTLGVALADVPEYADQAAAATGLTGTGRWWRQTTTGLIGITIT